MFLQLFAVQQVFDTLFLCLYQARLAGGLEASQNVYLFVLLFV